MNTKKLKVTNKPNTGKVKLQTKGRGIGTGLLFKRQKTLKAASDLKFNYGWVMALF